MRAVVPFGVRPGPASSVSSASGFGGQSGRAELNPVTSGNSQERTRDAGSRTIPCPQQAVNFGDIAFSFRIRRYPTTISAF